MKIVLIGASVRPLISSCIAAGISPVAFDLFADWDSRQMIKRSGLAGAGLKRIDAYNELLSWEFEALGEAAIFSGGAELVTDLVERVGESIQVFGAGAKSLSILRDPMNWLRFLRSEGFNVPESRQSIYDFSPGPWLRKSVGRCGGRGIQLVGAALDFEKSNNVYFQKLMSGRSFSAQFVSQINTGGCVLLGICRQIFSESSPFEYAGSVFPANIPPEAIEHIQEIGCALADEFNLVGVWGVDFVMDETNNVWPVDLNPRVTASTELLEAMVRSNTNAKSVVDLQRMSSHSGDLKIHGSVLGGRSKHMFEAKLILFNRSNELVHIDQATFDWLAERCDFSFERSTKLGANLADVPQLGQQIRPGHPVLTVRIRAKDQRQALMGLRDHSGRTLEKLNLEPVDLDWQNYE